MASTYHEQPPRDPHSKTGRVWRLAEEITRAKGRRAKRSEVIEAYVAEGGHPDTASTQYWRWKKAYEADAEGSSENARNGRPRTTGPVQLTVGPDGRLSIPAEMRAAMEVGRDGKVTARVVDGELRLLSGKVGIRRAQDAVRRRIPSGVSLADELIAERRAEARKEAAS